MHFAYQLARILPVILLVVYGSRYLERKWPIAATPRSEVQDDWLAVMVSLGIPIIFNPITSVTSATILSYTGFGWVHLPVTGYWYVVSLLVTIVIVDFYNYAYHRVMHAVPFLWALHSFHHSANALTLVTGGRHVWIERVLNNGFLPILAILFQIPPSMAMIVGIVSFLPDSCAHLNVRIPLGRFVTWMNNPQWHRIHHSVQPEHFDKNFAGILTIWDFAFGTAYVPRPDEYPDTGLVPAERVDVIDSIIWPFRHLRHRRIASFQPVTPTNN